MSLTKAFCAAQVQRLEGLPYFASIGPIGFEGLWNAMRDAADTEDEARAAIDALLRDTARAASTETNRVPSPGELRIWIEAQRSTKYDTPQFRAEYCDECRGGRPQGWITRTVWRDVRGKVDEDGNQLQQPYTFSGRCRCQPGGWA